MSILSEETACKPVMTPEGRFRCPQDKKVYATREEFQKHLQLSHKTAAASEPKAVTQP